jgi:hypothetical protein
VTTGILLLTILLAFDGGAAAHDSGGDRRSVSGNVYFTNDTPRDRAEFPIELFTRDEKTLVASSRQGRGDFKFEALRPGRYILRLTWTDRCTLRYAVDVRERSRSDVTVVMDAACSSNNGRARDLPPDRRER